MEKEEKNGKGSDGMKKRICMIIPNPMVKGGIAAVVNGYRGSKLEEDYKITYVESYRDGSKFAKLLKGIGGYFHFAMVLLFHKPDIVHIHSSFGPSFYRKMPFIYMASWRKIPIVNHIHGADFDEFYVNASEEKKAKIKKVYSKCNVLIALSEEWKERLSQIVPRDRIEIIENYSVLHEDALEERMQRECNNTAVRFVLAGAGSEVDEKAIKKLIDENDVSNNVEFPGWVRGDTKDNLLREADVFFLPSYNEGMPMSVLDAMGYGLPVVSTNVGGIPKIVRNKENGCCCEAGDTDTYVREIINLLNSDKWRFDAANASLEIIKKGYSLEAHLHQLERVYEENLK